MTTVMLDVRPITTGPTVGKDETAEEPRTGVVVVALPAADQAAHRVGAEEKHQTLLYLGDVGDNPHLTDAFHRELSAAVAVTAATHGPVTSDVTGVQVLGADAALVWATDAALRPVRNALLEVPDIADAWSAIDQFPTWLPHVTIGYPPATEDPDLQRAAAGLFAVTFDRLAIWWAGTHTTYPLTGDQS